MDGICREQPGDDTEKLAILRRLRLDFANQTDEELRFFSSNYGWIYVAQIINNSDNKVHFSNPYRDTSGDIDPGDSDTSDSTGYVPFWSHDKRYELEYYNTVLDGKKKIEIKDLEGDWLASFYHDEIEEDIRNVEPVMFTACLTIVFTNNGYDVYESGKKKGGIFWESS